MPSLYSISRWLWCDYVKPPLLIDRSWCVDRVVIKGIGELFTLFRTVSLAPRAFLYVQYFEVHCLWSDRCCAHRRAQCCLTPPVVSFSVWLGHWKPTYIRAYRTIRLFPEIPNLAGESVRFFPVKHDPKSGSMFRTIPHFHVVSEQSPD